MKQVTAVAKLMNEKYKRKKKNKRDRKVYLSLIKEPSSAQKRASSIDRTSNASPMAEMNPKVDSKKSPIELAKVMS